MANHTASEVAKWFLSHNRVAMDEESAEYITNLKLQKLLYYAQGCFLAITGNPLFDDPILAWQHGPVVRSVYDEYKHNGSEGIKFEDDFDVNQFTKQENSILTQVYDEFGQFSAWKLRNMTHNEAPWKETLQNHEIKQDKIKSFFEREYVEQ